jgi:hypothetical protein
MGSLCSGALQAPCTHRALLCKGLAEQSLLYKQLGRRSPSSSKDDEKASQLQQVSAELVLTRGRVAALEADQEAKDTELRAALSKQQEDCLTYVRMEVFMLGSDGEGKL